MGPKWTRMGTKSSVPTANMAWNAFIASALMGCDDFGAPALEKPAAATHVRQQAEATDAATVMLTIPVLVNGQVLEEADATMLHYCAPRPRGRSPKPKSTPDIGPQVRLSDLGQLRSRNRSNAERTWPDVPRRCVSSHI